MFILYDSDHFDLVSSQRNKALKKEGYIHSNKTETKKKIQWNGSKTKKKTIINIIL